MFTQPETWLTLLIGFAVRIGLPLLITALVVWALKRLDAHWQAEALAERQAKLQAAAQACPVCWQVRQCSPEQRQACPAFQNAQRQPCWQTKRDLNHGQLPAQCFDCDVFQTATQPA